MTSIAVLPSRMSSSYPEQRRTARPQIRHRPGFTHAPKLFHSRSLLHLYSSTLSSKKTAKSKSLTPIFSAALSHSFSLSITLKPVSPLLATLTKSTPGYPLPLFQFSHFGKLRGELSAVAISFPSIDVFRMPLPARPKLYFPLALMRDSLSVAQAMLLATSARHRLFARAHFRSQSNETL